MNPLIIINPASAGGRTSARVEAIRSGANQNFSEYQLIVTEGPGHATQISRDALKANKADCVIIVGGDGTINEVVNGFYDGDQPIREQPTIGVIPSGSGQDFVRSCGIDDSIEEALQRISSNQPRTIDLARMIPLEGEPRVFANISSVGLSAEIGIKTNESWLKKVNGTAAFNWSIVTTAIRHKRYPLLIKTADNTDGELWDANCVAICNGQYFGSGVKVGAGASLEDNQLEVAIVHDLSAIGFLKGVSAIKKDESHTPEGITRFKTTWIEITCNDPMRITPIETDGEASATLPARFEVLPNAVQLL